MKKLISYGGEASKKNNFKLNFNCGLQNALLQETTEEWEQCDRKLRETQGWIDKTKQESDRDAGKRKPLRDQLAAKEKTIADVAIQKTKIALAVEKLQVVCRSSAFSCTQHEAVT